MMMKKLLFSSLFLLGSLVSQAQHEYTIKGEVKGCLLYTSDAADE